MLLPAIVVCHSPPVSDHQVQVLLQFSWAPSVQPV